MPLTKVTSGVRTIASSEVVTASIADDAITLAKMAPGTDGNLITYDTLRAIPAHVSTGTERASAHVARRWCCASIRNACKWTASRNIHEQRTDCRGRYSAGCSAWSGCYPIARSGSAAMQDRRRGICG